MSFEPEFTKRFDKDFAKIEKGDPKRVKQIQFIIQKIIENPFDLELYKERIKGTRDMQFRYLIGRNYRLLIEIEIMNNKIIFKRIGRRENFYSQI